MSPLRTLFGPSRETIWRQLAAELDAEYAPGGFFKSGAVRLAHGEWTLTLDTYVVSTGKTVIVFTRMRAPYVNPGGFRFNIYRRGFFSDLAKRFGMQDIEIGHPDFDRDFIIKSSDEGKVKRLLADGRLRSLIALQPQIHLEVKDREGRFGPDFPEDTDELCFHVTGVIKDVPRLKQLFELFAETLDELCRMGAAYERAPDIKL
ncbi:MAG TPA: DUF3137 domain-containing protein [Planctomycetota bacterium]|nr:DUF3137 domain-containing protein [Planctomycetota bacterium]